MFLIIFLLFLSLPTPLFAAGCAVSVSGEPKTFGDVICVFVDLITTAIPVVAGLALVVFFWGLAKLILNAGNETGREEGKLIMKWGIVALFVLVSIWGLVAFIAGDIFGFSPIRLPVAPILPT